MKKNILKVTTAATTSPLTPAFCATALVTVLFSLIVLYMYFLSFSVVHVVLRKEVNQSQMAVRSDISRLEAKFIEAQHQVSEKIASAKMLSETDEKIFVHRVSPTLVLSGSVQ